MSSTSSRFSPARGSSKSEQFGIQGQGPAQFDPFLQAVRQHADRFIADRFNFEQIDDFLFNKFPGLDFFPGRFSKINGSAQDAGLQMDMTAQTDVVETVIPRNNSIF